MRELTPDLPNNPRLRGMSHRHRLALSLVSVCADGVGRGCRVDRADLDRLHLHPLQQSLRQPLLGHHHGGRYDTAPRRHPHVHSSCLQRRRCTFLTWLSVFLLFLFFFWLLLLLSFFFFVCLFLLFFFLFTLFCCRFSSSGCCCCYCSSCSCSCCCRCCSRRCCFVAVVIVL